MASASIFSATPLAAPDIILNLSVMAKADTDPSKIDLGVGAYRDDNGQPWVLPSVRKAERQILEDPTSNHEYLAIAGFPSFIAGARKLILGADSPAIKEERSYTIQTISGTGAVALGALFLEYYKPDKASIVYISKPTWANHRQIFETMHHEVREYPYYHPATRGLDFEGFTGALESAPEGSIFVIHACAHNPTGVDPSDDQWKAVAEIMKRRKLFPFFDCAYQGFRSGNVDKDASAVRYFVEQGFELFVCQSFAKNFGLYGERTGALTVVLKDKATTALVSSQLNRLSRATISTASAYGAKIVGRILSDEQLYKDWTDDIETMSSRIYDMRQKLYDHLIKLGTPGTWNHILDQQGMFTFTGLTVDQVHALRSKHHAYLTDNGRVSMAGLNNSNVERFARAVDDVVRNVGHTASLL
ncbi:aspartate aminotransferase [Ramicandelaber brevisporus]|nr:aspartate aminotransferase [Ramicandelaber brevisporus]